MASLRVVVFGYRDVGHACLEVLLERGVDVVALFSHEHDAQETAWFPSVAALARAHGAAMHDRVAHFFEHGAQALQSRSACAHHDEKTAVLGMP